MSVKSVRDSDNSAATAKSSFVCQPCEELHLHRVD